MPPWGLKHDLPAETRIDIEDAKIIEHWASRDDLGMAKHLGWILPTPVYLLEMASAKRHARRA